MNTNVAKKLNTIANLVKSDDPLFYNKLKVSWSRLNHKTRGKLKESLRRGRESQVAAGLFLINMRKFVEI